jgi:hypothetical protein
MERGKPTLFQRRVHEAIDTVVTAGGKTGGATRPLRYSLAILFSIYRSIVWRTSASTVMPFETEKLFGISCLLPIPMPVLFR